MKSRVFVFYVAILCALIGTLFLTLTGAQAQPGATVTPTPQPSPTAATAQDAIEWAQRASEDSSRAVDAAGNILSMVEAFGVLLGAAIALIGIIGALVGLRTFADFSRRRQEFDAEMAQAIDRLHTFEKEMQERRAQGDRSIRALTLLQVGKQQIDAGNIQAARSTLLQAHTYDSDNQAVNYFLGELYINQLDDLDAGIEHLKKAGAESNDEQEMFLAAKATYAYALRRKGDRAAAGSQEQRDYYLRSELFFRQALDRNPLLLDITGAPFYGSLGGLYQRQGRIREAIECYEKAVEATRSMSSYPYNNLGILSATIKDMKKAKYYFELAVRAAAQSIDDKPHDYWARFDMVTAQIMLGHAEEVKKHLQQAFQSAPGVEPLSKFLGGLKRLQQATSSELLDAVIASVQREIDQRAQHEEDEKHVKQEV